MPEALKILGQAAPAAATNANLYTAVPGASAVVSSLVMCNTGAAATEVRVYARPAGAAAALGNAVVFDAPIEGNDILALTLGITLGATDILTVRSTAGGVTFTAFGTEVTE
jgi:hypothetical protein